MPLALRNVFVVSAAHGAVLSLDDVAAHLEPRSVDSVVMIVHEECCGIIS